MTAAPLFRSFGRLAALLLAWLLLAPGSPALAARQNVHDWYIQDLTTEIRVNPDSSLDVTESITADCGDCTGRHGIFRTVPTARYLKAGEPTYTPVELQGITDFAGQALQYTESRDTKNHTLTWKIGDPGRTVQGVNTYRIRYHVKNAVLFENPDFDEFYWNLNGSFWQLDIDSFRAVVSFPPALRPDAASVSLYSGAFKAPDNGLARYAWDEQGRLIVTALRPLAPGEGATVSVTAPKGIFTPYQLTDADRQLERWGVAVARPAMWLVILGDLLGLLLPFLAYQGLIRLWRRYGKDPRISPVVAPEFDVPGRLPPIELALVEGGGTLGTNAVTAGIIDLAVKGYLTIEKVEKKLLFGHRDEYVLHAAKQSPAELPLSEKLLYERLFANGPQVATRDLVNSFYKDVAEIRKQVTADLTSRGLLDLKGRWIGIIGIILVLVLGGPLLVITAFAAVFLDMVLLPVGAGVALLIALVLLAVMGHRTEQGAEVYRQVRGYKLYLKTAERYRAQFYERENIFERFLPYAILFGLTGQWIRAFQSVYGEEQARAYAPVWLGGAGLQDMGHSLDSVISDMSSAIGIAATSSPSSSGAGGGGFSGGGGGGGGGGGW